MRRTPLTDSPIASLATVAAAVLAVLLSAGASRAALDEARLVPLDATLHDAVGTGVAASGDTALVGAPWDSDRGSKSGSLYVFERGADGAGGWGQAQKLTAADGGPGDLFGWAVAIDGDTVVVGAPGDSDRGLEAGSIYVFERGAGGFGQVQKIILPDPRPGDRFGFSVSPSGDRLLVGAYGDDAKGTDAGAAYLFERNGAGQWSLVKKLLTSDAEPGEQTGWSVAIDGEIAVVGAPKDNDSGRAYVFRRNSGGPGAWGEAKKLAANNQSHFEEFGWSVAVGGDIVLVAARLGENGPKGGPRTGWVEVFDAAKGLQDVKKLVASDGLPGDWFGASVAIHDDMVIVGAPGRADAGVRSGAAYVLQFQRLANSTLRWTELRKLTASDAAAEDHFGASVAIARGAAVVGAPGPPVSGLGAGAAYLFAARRGAVCHRKVRTDCTADWKGGMLLLDEREGKERLVVRMRRGPEVKQIGFGNPLVPGGTAYQACIYDELGFLRATWQVDAAGLDCNGTPCWQALGALPPGGKGYLYKRGKRQLRLRAGKAGKSVVVLTARKGANPGPDDPPSGVTVHLEAGSTVQLVGDDASECFSLTVNRLLEWTQKRFHAKK